MKIVDIYSKINTQVKTSCGKKGLLKGLKYTNRKLKFIIEVDVYGFITEVLVNDII